MLVYRESVLNELPVCSLNFLCCSIKHFLSPSLTHTPVAAPSTGPPGVFIVRDTASSSNELRLICHVSGQPLPAVTWKLNGTEIVSDTRHTVTQSGDNSILVVTSPEWGRYSCEGSNVNPYEAGSSPQTSSDSYNHGSGNGEYRTYSTVCIYSGTSL